MSQSNTGANGGLRQDSEPAMTLPATPISTPPIQVSPQQQQQQQKQQQMQSLLQRQQQQQQQLAQQQEQLRQYSQKQVQQSQVSQSQLPQSQVLQQQVPQQRVHQRVQESQLQQHSVRQPQVQKFPVQKPQVQSLSFQQAQARQPQVQQQQPLHQSQAKQSQLLQQQGQQQGQQLVQQQQIQRPAQEQAHQQQPLQHQIQQQQAQQQQIQQQQAQQQPGSAIYLSPQVSAPIDPASLAGQANKRPTEDSTSSVPKRTKTTDGTLTPGLMGPPSSAISTKKKDEGLDEGDPNDILGGAGINLQDEERHMTSFEVPRSMNASAQVQQTAPGDQARKSDFLDFPAFQYAVNQKLMETGLNKFEVELHGLIGIALKERLSGLVSRMVVLAKHRCAPPPANATPLDDVGKILRNISIKEAQEEERRRTAAATRRAEEEVKRREAEEASSASKRKPARTISEQAAARNANATAQMMMNQSGGKKYSWMTGAPNTSQLSRRTTTQTGTAVPANVFKTGSEELAGHLTLVDFINAMELDGENQFGRGGKALLKAYTQLKD